MAVIHKRKMSEPLDVAVVEAFEVCSSVDLFRKYEYPPPDNLKVCNHLLDKYEEEIEMLLMKKVEDPEQKICFELSKACGGNTTGKDSKLTSEKNNENKDEL
ncbi:uncharacterized protein TRIADDRAFT_53739 [Trichoplax adhaerens]|uniref:DUF3456 domain-containing protein n=1 Tax=Trichoplax adhaerens TaxID=10228 RepID=B3RQ13_TRIAD|nr:predicted protein [Trichoplax adhaerens]EDV27741.1 predicted protein [Trichoplax adhaerens]|eukprot:XP_002109575.1 predicted protein [Trichoplax adhaerens]